jgi:hypothetical protein
MRSGSRSTHYDKSQNVAPWRIYRNTSPQPVLHWQSSGAYSASKMLQTSKQGSQN